MAPEKIEECREKLIAKGIAAEEFRLLVELLGFSREEIRALTESAVRVSWLSDEDKRELHGSFLDDPVWQEQP